MLKNINIIKSNLKEDTLLVGVSKYHTIDEIDNAFSCGIDTFGENHVQELVKKYTPKYKWHFIGHLQTNKVKSLLPVVDMIESLDSIKLAKEIQKEASKINKIIPVLIQVNISNEEQKYGFRLEEVIDVANIIFENMSNIKIEGLMCIASDSDDYDLVSSQFKSMQDKYIEFKDLYPDDIKYLSMGMSNDYKLALKYGSNIVRIGTMIFGERSY